MNFLFLSLCCLEFIFHFYYPSTTISGEKIHQVSSYENRILDDVGLNLRVKDSLNTALANNVVGGNLRVINTENVGMQDNSAVKNVSVTKANDAQIFDSHAGKNFVIKNNVDCIHAGITADGKVKIKDCTDVTIPE